MRKNRIKKSAKTTLVIAVVTCGAMVLAGGQVALADTMSSASYRIEADVISIGGNRSTSGSYTIEDTIGEMATGEDLSSASFLACAGYQCFVSAEYISFSITQGLSSPGVAGAGVDLGVLTVTDVATSDGASVNSIFVTAESNSGGGSVIQIAGTNGGLASASVPSDLIPSSTASLTAGTEGFGVCVESTSESSESPTALNKASPYDGSCDKSSNHDVGIVDDTQRTILSAGGAFADGAAEILVKTAIANASPAHPDYNEILTLTMTTTF